MRKAVCFFSLLTVLIGVAACGFTPDTESDVLTVEFETNGGEAIESVDVEVGETLTLPTPEREGYRFEGWYALEDLSGSSLSEFPAVTGGTITLYADWIQTRFTLTFDSMGGTPIDPMVKNEGDALDPPEAPVREGYTFLGWFTDDLFTEAFSFDAVLEQDSNLFAAWEGNDYTITFDERGGSDVPDITAAYEEAIEAPTPPTRLGYTFDGWYLDDTFDDAFTFDTMPLDGATLYAKWDPALVDVTIHRYTEDLNQEDYTLETTEVVEAYTESTYTLEQSSIPGFTPDPGHDSSVTSGTVLADGSLELTLYYSRDEITLTYETNADFSIASSRGLYEAPLSAPEDPERLGYIFEGWFSDPDFETEYVFSTFPAQDTTIYADWEGTPSTIHFNSHGGSAVESLTANNGDAITLIEPTRDGYDFEGWYLSDDYLNVFDDTTMPVGGASLHAKWKPATYTLTFETGEGSAIDALELGFEEELTLPDDPVLDGHAFTGWFMDAEFTEPFDLSTMPSNDLTVYARFIESTNPNSVINQTTQDEGSAVEVQGVVYHTFTSAYQGFMIFDETGQVFINHSHNGLEIGDRVTIEGVLEFDEGIPLIAGVEEVDVVSSGHATKTAKPMDFEDFKDLTPTRHTVHDVYTLHGLFHEMSDDYYLIDFDNTDFGLPVYYKSYLTEHIAQLDDALSERVNLTFAWVQTDEGPVLSLIDIEEDPLSDDEILDLVKAFAEETLGTPDFQSGDTLDMPSNDPLNLTTIAVEAVGVNADYFDPSTSTFEETGETVVIDFEVTIRLIGSSAETTFTFEATLRPVIISTIAELLNGEEGEFYRVQGIITSLSGVITSVSDMDMAVIKDETGTVFVEDLGDVEIGDEVDITLRRDMLHGAVYPRHEDGGIVLNAVLSKENEIGHDPETLTPSEVAALDPDDPDTHGRYVEVRGFIIEAMNAMADERYLVHEDYLLQIMPFTYSGYEKLYDYSYMDVYMRGYLFVSDDGSLSIVYEGIRQDIRVPEYSDAERIEAIETMLYHMYAGREFYGLQSFEMMAYHPILGGDIAWSMNETTASVYDQSDKQFLPVLEDTPLSFTITISEGSQSKVLTFNATLKAVALTPVANLHENDAYGEHYVEGILVYWHPDFAVLMDDEGDTVRLDMELPYLRRGDHVILHAEWQDNNGTVVSLVEVSDSDDGDVHIVSRENPFTLSYVETSVEDLYDMDLGSLRTFNRFIEVTGLIEVPNPYAMYLKTPEDSLRIIFPDTYTKSKLGRLEDSNVTLRAYLYSYDDWNNILEIMFVGREGDVEETPYSEQEQFDIMKAYIIDTYDTTIEGGQALDFTTVHDLFTTGEALFVPEGEHANLVDVDSDYVHEVDASLDIPIEVTLTVGDVNETFTITLTLIPEEADDIVTLETMASNLGRTYTTRAEVIAYVRMKNHYVFMLEDETGVVFMPFPYGETDYIYYDHYIGDTLEVRGHAVKDKGRIMLEPESWRIHNRYGTVSKEFELSSLIDINEMSLYDATIYGRAVNITGTVVREDLDHVAKYYIESGRERVLISHSGTWHTLLSDHVGRKVSLDGFVFGSNANYDTDRITLILNDYDYDGESPVKLSGYSDGEVVELALEAIVEEFELYNRVYDPYDYIWFSDVPDGIKEIYPGIERTITPLENGEYLDGSGSYFMTKVASEDKEIRIQVTVTYDGISKSDVVIIRLNGFEIVSLETLFEDIPGTFEIALSGQYIHSGFGFYYFLIEDKVYYLETYRHDYAYKGDEVLIVAKKNVIDGIPDYTYDIRFITLDSDMLPLTPEDTTIETLYTNDHEANPMRFDYWTVEGLLGYDPNLMMYTLEDDYGLIYIRTSDRAYEYTDVFMDYIGETVRVDILLPMKTVRDEYILVDSPGGYQDIEAPYMTEQELIDATIARLEAMSPISIQSGDFIGAFPPWYSYYDVHIDYEVADPIDALYIDTDNLVANTVNEATDVVVKATVTPYGSVISGTAYLTYRIHPKETVPIKDVLFGRPDRIYQVEGIVIAASGLDQDEPWMIVEDESGRIYVDLSTADYTLFDVDDITYEVGDEVRIIARMGHFDYDGIIPNLTNVRVVDVRSSDNTFTHEPITMTFEDILELDYLYPETFYQYIEITADLNLRYNRYELNDDDYYSDDYYGIMHYPLGLKGQDSTFSATMGDLTGETITVRGYLIGFEYMNADFDWYMAYVSHDTVPVS